MPNVTDPGPHGDSGPGQHALTVIVGAHGGIGIRVGALLAARGDRVRGVIRQADQKADIARVGMEPVVADLESATVTEFTEIVAGARTVIFTADKLAAEAAGSARTQWIGGASVWWPTPAPRPRLADCSSSRPCAWIWCATGLNRKRPRRRSRTICAPNWPPNKTCGRISNPG